MPRIKKETHLRIKDIQFSIKEEKNNKAKVRIGGEVTELIYLANLGKGKQKKFPVNIYIKKTVDGSVSIKLLVNGLEVPGGLIVNNYDGNGNIAVESNIGGKGLIGYDVPVKMS